MRLLEATRAYVALQPGVAFATKTLVPRLRVRFVLAKAIAIRVRSSPTKTVLSRKTLLIRVILLAPKTLVPRLRVLQGPAKHGHKQ